MSQKPALLVALALACLPSGSGTGMSASTASDGSAGTTLTSGDVPTGVTVPTSGATGTPTGDLLDTTATQDPSTGAAEGPDGTFVSPMDQPPPGFHCDWFAQDCPTGEKCMPLVEGVVSYTGEPVCVPLPPDPAPLGSACQLLGDPWIDDCEPGTVCLEVTPEGFGTCRQICLQYDQKIPCTMPDTTCIGLHCESCNTLFCQPVCDPLDPLTCVEGMLCIDEGYCLFDASGDEGQAGDPCAYLNDCDPGHMCLSVESVPDCAGDSGCCAAFCDLDVPDPCPGAPPGVTCVAIYAEGEAPAEELADLGVCILVI